MNSSVTSVTVKIYAVIKSQIEEDKIILSTSKKGLNFIQGKYKAIDPSSIFAATRIFLKKLFIEEKNSSDWHTPLFQHWLPKFTNCELVRHDNGNYSFMIEIPEGLINSQNPKLQFIGLPELQSKHTLLYTEYQYLVQDILETYQFYETSERAKNHFAIFNCEPDPGFVNFYEALYQGHLKNKGEIWRTYKIPLLEFPTEEELQKFKGIVISGSEWSVYDPSFEAIPIFLERLRNLVEYYPHIKIVGICFGSQSLAQTLGGRVGKMKLDNKPMLMNREKISFLNEFGDRFVKKLKVTEYTEIEIDYMHIVECHGDNVEVLPDGAILYGTSNATPVEIWGIEERILAFQGHPEFNAAIMIEKIIPEEKENIVNYDDVFEESKTSLLSGGIDTKLMAILCESFLKECY